MLYRKFKLQYYLSLEDAGVDLVDGLADNELPRGIRFGEMGTGQHSRHDAPDFVERTGLPAKRPAGNDETTTCVQEKAP
jgi:hypothetical protein